MLIGRMVLNGLFGILFSVFIFMEPLEISFHFAAVDHTATVTREKTNGHTHYKVTLLKSGDVYVSKKDGKWTVCCGPSTDIDHGVAPVIGREIENHLS